MKGPKSSPKLALVVGVGKAKGDSEDAADMAEDEAAYDELASVLGVPEAKREQFREAFEAAVMCCKE